MVEEHPALTSAQVPFAKTPRRCPHSSLWAIILAGGCLWAALLTRSPLRHQRQRPPPHRISTLGIRTASSGILWGFSFFFNELRGAGSLRRLARASSAHARLCACGAACSRNLAYLPGAHAAARGKQIPRTASSPRWVCRAFFGAL